MKRMRNYKTLFFLPVLALFMACGSDNSDGNESGGSGGNTPPDEGTTSELVATLPKKTNAMNVYAHFMVWFETDKTAMDAGKWGWHWTMNNTSLTPSNGEIASHYHPLTGPYASGDPDILDYQCLLMKYSGIDGVIVDWYGANADNTVARHTSNTEALLHAIEKAGMKLAVMYEDNAISSSDMVSAGRTDMTYLNQKFFSSKSYTRIDNRPLLMDFGPQKINDPKDWYRIFQVLATKPYFVVLNGTTSKANNSSYHNSEGEFLWVNPDPAPWYAGNKANFNMTFGGAMPGFHDYYKEGNSGNGYTTYDAENGALFERQLKAAKDAQLDWLQVSTWNDYGEGTIIEPTQETGYRYLTALQKFTGCSCSEANLKAIYQWYTLRVKYASNTAKRSTLDQCYKLFNAMQPDKAAKLMEGL